jgi:hypothetical protein
MLDIDGAELHIADRVVLLQAEAGLAAGTRGSIGGWSTPPHLVVLATRSPDRRREVRVIVDARHCRRLGEGA